MKRNYIVSIDADGVCLILSIPNTATFSGPHRTGTHRI